MSRITTFPGIKAGFRSASGVIFPQLYRASGYYFDLQEKDGEHIAVANDRKGPYFYTLSPSDTGGFANVTYEEIDRLTPGIDTGWVMIRKHSTQASVDGYFDALEDLIPNWHAAPGFVVVENGFGLFTLRHRAATPGCEDCLVAYSIPGYFHAQRTSERVVINSRGEICDWIILEPPEERENIRRGRAELEKYF
jgi:hypothetical protein